MSKPRQQLILIGGGGTFDITNFVESTTISGSKGTPPRSLEATLVDANDESGHDKVPIDIFQGNQCIFRWDGEELFRGTFFVQSHTKAKHLPVKAYDNMFYLANNKDSFNFEKKTASEIFKKLCSQFGIQSGKVSDTGYIIPSLPKPKTTIWDVMADAISITYKATGKKFYIYSDKGKVNLINRKESIKTFAITEKINLVDYQYEKNLEKLVTRVKSINAEGDVVAFSQNSSLESKFGILQDIDEVSSDLCKAQIKERNKKVLDENKPQEMIKSLTAVGESIIRSGDAIILTIDSLKIKGSYYVDSDSHTFKDNYHEMQLNLTKTDDF